MHNSLFTYYIFFGDDNGTKIRRNFKEQKEDVPQFQHYFFNVYLRIQLEKRSLNKLFFAVAVVSLMVIELNRNSIISVMGWKNFLQNFFIFIKRGFLVENGNWKIINGRLTSKQVKKILCV